MRESKVTRIKTSGGGGGWMRGWRGDINGGEQSVDWHNVFGLEGQIYSGRG